MGCSKAGAGEQATGVGEKGKVGGGGGGEGQPLSTPKCHNGKCLVRLSSLLLSLGR